MSQEQAYLSPDQQDALFQALKAASQIALQSNQPSPATIGLEKGESQNTPDTQAQTGLPNGGADYSQLQNLWRDAGNPANPVAMQPGDKMHPTDAINQIVSGMTNGGSGNGSSPVQNAPGQTTPPVAPGQTPSPVATGVPAMQNAPANGIISRLLGRTIPGYSAQVPASGIIPNILGVKQSVPLGTENYYGAIKQAGFDQYLPQGLPKLPDGTPFVSKDVMDQVRQTAWIAGRTNNLGGNQVTFSKGVVDAMSSSDNIKDRIAAVAKAWEKENPGQDMPAQLVAQTVGVQNAATKATGTANTNTNATVHRLTDAQSKMNADTKKEKDALDASGTSSALIQDAMTNPVSWSALPITLARELTGTSRINVQEINRLGGTQAIIGKVAQIVKTNAAGTVTGQNAQFFNQLSSILTGAHQANIQATRIDHAAQWAQTNGIPIDQAYQQLTGQAAPSGLLVKDIKSGVIGNIGIKKYNPNKYQIQ